jgi:glycosyltransferase involved in cell wall biosynthesis
MPPEQAEGPSPSEVAFVHDSRRFDGMFQMMEFARTALVDSSVRVRTYTCYDPSLAEQYPDLGTRVAGHRIPPGGDLERGVNRWLPVFARRLRTLEADLIHLWSSSLAEMVRGRDNVVITIPDLAKTTTRYYGRIPSYLHNRLLPLVRQANGLVAHTEWTRADIVRVLSVDLDRISVVPPWVSVVTDPRPIERVFRTPTLERPWTLLAVATDRPHKNLGFFLDVLSRLDRRYRGVVVSRPGPATLARVRSLGLTDRVRFVHGLPELGPTFAEAEVYIHPSLYEGFGIPILEAMARRVPVIASDRTCIPEVVGAGGRVLGLEDPRVWARAVESLADPGIYGAAVEAATRRAAEFTPERTRGALLDTYRAAMLRRRGH